MSLKGVVVVIEKIVKSCKTCEFNLNSGICASHGSDYDYGGKITNFNKQRECWSIGLEYFSELLEKLPEIQKQKVKRGIKELNDFYDI